MDKLNALAARAVDGEQAALNELLEALKTPVYNLALRMVRVPQDAEDAAQEILIKVVTHLGSFRGESALLTWVYRIATNHLLNEKRRRLPQLSFDVLGEQLQMSLADPRPTPDVEVAERLLIEEVKRSCTLGMVMCLTPDLRMALILGELYEVSSEEGSYIMGISPDAYRKRLSRSRAAMRAFLSSHCGLINADSPCRCRKHVGNKIRAGALSPAQLDFAHEQDAKSQQQALLAEQATLAQHRRIAALLRSHPMYQGSAHYSTAVKQIVDVHI